MDLQCTDVLKFKEIEVEVHEMTSQELVDCLEGRNVPPFDVATALILNNGPDGSHPVHQQLLYRCSTLTEDTAAKLTPRQIVAVADRVRDLNPFYFPLRAKLEAAPDPGAETQGSSAEAGPSSSSEA